MKVFVIFALFCVAVATVKADEEPDKLFKDCITETKATEVDVANFHKLQPSKTREERCLRACVLKKSGVMDDKNRLVMDKEKETVKLLAHGNEAIEKILDVAVKNCGSMSDLIEDECEAAEAYNICASKVAIEAFVDGLVLAAAVPKTAPTDTPTV